MIVRKETVVAVGINLNFEFLNLIFTTIRQVGLLMIIPFIIKDVDWR